MQTYRDIITEIELFPYSKDLVQLQKEGLELEILDEYINNQLYLRECTNYQYTIDDNKLFELITEAEEKSERWYQKVWVMIANMANKIWKMFIGMMKWIGNVFAKLYKVASSSLYNNLIVKIKEKFFSKNTNESTLFEDAQQTALDEIKKEFINHVDQFTRERENLLHNLTDIFNPENTKDRKHLKKIRKSNIVLISDRSIKITLNGDSLELKKLFDKETLDKNINIIKDIFENDEFTLTFRSDKKNKNLMEVKTFYGICEKIDKAFDDAHRFFEKFMKVLLTQGVKAALLITGGMVIWKTFMACLVGQGFVNSFIGGMLVTALACFSITKPLNMLMFSKKFKNKIDINVQKDAIYVSKGFQLTTNNIDDMSKKIDTKIKDFLNDPKNKEEVKKIFSFTNRMKENTKEAMKNAAGYKFAKIIPLVTPLAKKARKLMPDNSDSDPDTIAGKGFKKLNQGINGLIKMDETSKMVEFSNLIKQYYAISSNMIALMKFSIGCQGIFCSIFKKVLRIA